MTEKKWTPRLLAREFASVVAERAGVALSEVHVMNAKESAAHGYMPDALATVAFESGGSVDMSEMLLDGYWHRRDAGLYLEAYSSWLVGVYRYRSTSYS